MFEVDLRRVVEVWNAAAGEVGTGCRVSDRHILTAKHLCAPGSLGTPVEVRLYDPEAAIPWTIARVCWSSRTRDLAVLEVDADDPAWTAEMTPRPVRGGMAAEHAFEVTSIGFPRAAVRSGGRRDTWSLRGRVDPYQEHRRFMQGTATIAVTESIVPKASPNDASPWSGASGAAVFVAATGHLLGVLTADAGIAATASVLRMELIASDPALLALLAAADPTAPVVAERALMILGGLLSPQAVAARFALPDGRRTFVGRQEELDEILTLLNPGLDPRGPLVVGAAVAGLAGAGKTELAIQAARAALNLGWYPGGVLFVDMQGYDEALRRDPYDVVRDVLHAFEIPAHRVPRAPDAVMGLYRSLMRELVDSGQRMLVVVDNVKTAEQARPLLPSSGAIITTRDALPALGARMLDLGVLSHSSAMSLLKGELNMLLGSEDTRVVDEPDAAAEIADLCGRLPLALHIAAARLAVQRRRPLEDLAGDLRNEEHRLDELEADDKKVKAAFSLSWRHLDRTHARIGYLAILNPGPETSTGAMAALAGVEVREARRAMEALAGAHLIAQVATPGRTPAEDKRWRMHDLVRLYAAEHLRTMSADVERNAAVARLLIYYLKTVKAADEFLGPRSRDPNRSRFGSLADALAWLDAERSTLIAAVELALEGHERLGYEISRGLLRYFHRRWLSEEWYETTLDGLTAARRLSDSKSEAWALVGVSGGARATGRFAEAFEAGLEALDIFENCQNEYGQGIALNNIGGALSGLGRHEEAVDYQHRALAIFQRSDRWLAGRILIALGTGQLGLGAFQEAESTFDESVHILSGGQIRDRHGWAEALSGRAEALRKLGRALEAVEAMRRAAELFREEQAASNAGWVLDLLGDTLLDLKKPEEAVAVYRDAAETHRSVGDLPAERQALSDWAGVLLLKLGRYSEAVEVLRRQLMIAVDIRDHHDESDVLLLLGETLRRSGRPDEAAGIHRRNLTLARHLDRPHVEGWSHYGLGLVLSDRSQYEKALGEFRDGAALARSNGDLFAEGWALLEAGRSLVRLMRFVEAVQAFQLSATRFQAVREEPGNGWALLEQGLALRYGGNKTEAATLLLRSKAAFEAAGLAEGRSEADALLESLGPTDSHLQGVGPDQYRAMQVVAPLPWLKMPVRKVRPF